MTDSPNIRALRAHLDNTDPERAAGRAVAQFEREAVVIPDVLTPQADAPSWMVRIHHDARELYRDLVLSGSRGLPLSQVGTGMGRERRTEALRLLRRSGRHNGEPAGLGRAQGRADRGQGGVGPVSEDGTSLNLAAVGLVRAHLGPHGARGVDRRLLETVALEVQYQDDQLLLLSAMAMVAASIVRGASVMTAALGKPVSAEELLDEIERGVRGDS